MDKLVEHFQSLKQDELTVIKERANELKTHITEYDSTNIHYFPTMEIMLKELNTAFHRAQLYQILAEDFEQDLKTSENMGD